MSPDKHIVGCFRCVCVCAVQTQIKFSVFHSICILMFMYLIVCYFTGLFYAVIRQISMLFIDNSDSVFCISTRSCIGRKTFWVFYINSPNGELVFHRKLQQRRELTSAPTNDVTGIQQQIAESPKVAVAWHAS